MIEIVTIYRISLGCLTAYQPFMAYLILKYSQEGLPGTMSDCDGWRARARERERESERERERTPYYQ